VNVDKSKNHYDHDFQLCTPGIWCERSRAKERYVSAQFAQLPPEVFLPLLSMAERHTDPRDHAVPLFPQYVFLRCDLTAHYFQIRYAPGVASFLQEGATLFPFRKAL
jgi:hypothetical protein